LPFGFRFPFRHTHSLKFLNPALEPAGVEFSKAVSQSADKYAADQNFARFVQLTCTARILGRLAEGIRNMRHAGPTL